MRSESPPPAPPAAASPESLGARVGPLLARLLEKDTLLRWLLVVGFIWVWLTLLHFTIAVTHGFPDYYGVRSSGSAAIGGTPAFVLALAESQASPLARLLIALYLVAPLLAIPPAIVAWLRLLQLTRLFVGLGMTVIFRGEIGSQTDKGSGVEQVTKVFLAWFQALALAWVAVLIATTLQTILLSSCLGCISPAPSATF